MFRPSSVHNRYCERSWFVYARVCVCVCVCVGRGGGGGGAGVCVGGGGGTRGC